MSAAFFTADDDPRVVLAALRAAMNGSGPALALGAQIPDDADLPPGTVAVVTTSGSTGVPKSVVLSRAALTSSALATAERIGTGAWLLALPAAYVAGLQVLVRSLVQGREPAILAGRFTPATFIAATGLMASAMGDEPVPRYTALVPAQLHTLLDAADEDPAVAGAGRAYAAILVGGQSLPQPMRDRAAEHGWHLVRTYGSTETSGGCVYDGAALAGTELRIADGELQVSGPTLAEGYLGDAERTDAAFVRDGDGIRWYRTGDAATIDADGILTIEGRLDNVIISGGVNVSLDRVERIVRGLHGLAGAVVVGVPDEHWGSVPVIVAADPPEDALDGARAAAAAEIGVAARPARLVAVRSIPFLPSGKPDRAAARALALA